MKFFFKTAFFLFAAAVSVLFCAKAFAQSGDFFGAQDDGSVKFTKEYAPEKFVNYYIDDTVEINNGESFCFPKTSVLRVKSGAELQIYVGGAVDIEGTLIIEQGARVTVSGELKIREGSKAECFGELVATKKSEVFIAGEFLNHQTAVFSGKTYIFRSGAFKNEGTVSFANSASATVSGTFDVSENGNLLIKGTFRTTLNARVSVEGYILLLGKYYNTGELFLRKGARDMLEDGQFITGKSGRIIDERTEELQESESEEASSGVLKGIDVSYWQGTINWKKVKAAGIDFAFMRASVGDYYTDETFYYNITQAQKNGIKVGAYHFLRADTVESAREEARFFIEAIKPYKLDFPAVLDIEDARQEKLGKEELTTIAKVFCEELKKAGYTPMIYASASWLNNKLDMKELSEYEVWVAHWGTLKPAFGGKYGVWQYSCKGIVSGISGAVDLDVSYKDYSKSGI